MSAATERSETLLSLFYRRVVESGEQTALHFNPGDGFLSVSWRELARRVRKIAAVLQNLGVEQGDRVAQISENRVEWIVADLAILSLGAIHAPIHASLAARQIAEQIADCNPRVVLLSNIEQWNKIADYAPSPLAGRTVVSYEPCPRPARHLTELVEQTPDAHARNIEAAALASITADDPATIIYTSGTTGESKGVTLTHGNLTSNTLGTLAAFSMTADDVRLTLLPLSHIFARTCGLYCWIAVGSQLALAQSRETVLADCAAIGPTLLNGVPYFFDRVARLVAQAEPEQTLAEQSAALRKLLGDRIRVCCSGGAALPDHTSAFYNERGVTLVQGYGLTETSPVMTVGQLEDYRQGTVGRAIAGVEIRIADDGEILTRGPHVMQGYWNRPEATAEAIRDGWLYTGDLGSLDDGYLRIVGRKKEILVTAGGKNVAPVMLEALLCEDPLVAQALVVGDGRNCLGAILIPDGAALAAELSRLGVQIDSTAATLTDPRVLEIYRRLLDQRLKGVSSYEQIRRFALSDRPFTIESGELTPTLKLRRNEITRLRADEIERLYAAS